MNSIVEEAKKWVGYLEKASNSNLNDFTANAGDNNYTRLQSITAITLAKA